MKSLPLRKFVFLGLTLSYCISSCTLKKSQKNTLHQAVIENFELSNKVILAATDNRILQYEQDLESATTSITVLVWMRKALFARDKVRSVISYVDTLKKKMELNDYLGIDQSASLQVRISSMIKDVEDSLAFRFEFQSYFLDTLDKKDFYERNFLETSDIGSQKLGLARLQNTLRNFENSVVAFCTSQSCRLKIVYDQYQTLVGQSSTIVRPGEKIEITAGLAAYTNTVKPKIEIDGKIVNIGHDGRAGYFIKASNVVGQYKTPVKISYSDAKGKLQVRDFTIRWEVKD